MIEVELRAFLSDELFDSLEQYLNNSCTFISKEKQITYYLDFDVDTRIQISEKKSRIWQKLGVIHDDSRKEIDIPLQKEDGLNMLELFKNLGSKIKIAWFRERKSFTKGVLKIELDNTIGYGKILEVEILCKENEVENSKKIIQNYFKELGVEISSKELFNECFKKYLGNWTNLTKGLDENWVNS
jgi:predicted adenylyl cyclase CyaB